MRLSRPSKPEDSAVQALTPEALRSHDQTHAPAAADLRDPLERKSAFESRRVLGEKSRRSDRTSRSLIGTKSFSVLKPSPQVLRHTATFHSRKPSHGHEGLREYAQEESTQPSPVASPAAPGTSALKFSTSFTSVSSSLSGEPVMVPVSRPSGTGVSGNGEPPFGSPGAYSFNPSPRSPAYYPMRGTPTALYASPFRERSQALRAPSMYSPHSKSFTSPYSGGLAPSSYLSSAPQKTLPSPRLSQSFVHSRTTRDTTPASSSDRQSRDIFGRAINDDGPPSEESEEEVTVFWVNK